jgi:hypothetical protein
MATALVVGNMVGSGVFLLPSSPAAYGPISLVAWVFTAAGAILLALVFARLARAYPKTGGPYAYARNHVLGNGAVLVGMSERTTPQAIELLARRLFTAGKARQVIAAQLPKRRAFMPLDTEGNTP